MDKIIFTKRFGTTKILPFLKIPWFWHPDCHWMVMLNSASKDGKDLKGGSSNIIKILYSLDWFKGKFTGNHGFYHQI